eukprot:gnl/Chilomastix_cuspidata/1241.p1 GENE.gnl/Chilomastix_cuspidata/1241~~gnl/Chilomastix_cuspidata/1241.p1  ORF type:complete len:418 (+),score=132.81 gnl/Chilomastix_cuspidata/1241:274-1527(+)
METATSYLYVLGLLVTGSINTVSKKLQNGTWTIGLDGVEEKFNKPWWQTGIMFIGEAFNMIVYQIVRCRRRKTQGDEKVLLENEAANAFSLIDPGDERVEAPKEALSMPLWKFILLGIALCSCDLVSTSLQGIGLLYVDASVYQLLRGAVIIFTGIFSIIFLKRRLRAFQWTGMFIVVLGLFCVGLSGFFGSEESGASAAEASLGIFLILFSQIFSATQFIIQEKTMKNLNLNPLKLVGIEGIIGAILTEVIVLPIMYFIPGEDHGSYENFIDAWVDVSNNAFLAGMVGLYCVSIAFFNFFSLSISKRFSSVHRTLFDSCRTVVVWVCQVIIYYAGAVNSHGEHYGEQITWWSLLQALGFVFLILGTLVHNDVKDFGVRLMKKLHIYKPNVTLASEEAARERMDVQAAQLSDELQDV